MDKQKVVKAFIKAVTMGTSLLAMYTLANAATISPNHAFGATMIAFWWTVFADEIKGEPIAKFSDKIAKRLTTIRD